MKVYDTPADGLADAMRLSAGMTAKLAVAGLELGGGKAVLAVPKIPEGDERRALLHQYGDLVASLGGNFLTSSDINTGELDMDVISERTEHVFGRSESNGGAGNPGPHTAMGVYHGIRASLAHVFGSSEVNGRTVLVQGAGSVGAPLATECDVYAPCAMGGTVSVDTVPQLRCRIVAGSANNQLAQMEAAESLRSRGILYAPDYVINAGGAIAIVGLESLGWSTGEVDAALARIGDTLTEIYRRAEAERISTAAAADAVARLAAA